MVAEARSIEHEGGRRPISSVGRWSAFAMVAGPSLCSACALRLDRGGHLLGRRSRSGHRRAGLDPRRCPVRCGRQQRVAERAGARRAGPGRPRRTGPVGIVAAQLFLDATALVLLAAGARRAGASDGATAVSLTLVVLGALPALASVKMQLVLPRALPDPPPSSSRRPSPPVAAGLVGRPRRRRLGQPPRSRSHGRGSDRRVPALLPPSTPSGRDRRRRHRQCARARGQPHSLRDGPLLRGSARQRGRPARDRAVGASEPRQPLRPAPHRRGSRSRRPGPVVPAARCGRSSRSSVSWSAPSPRHATASGC